MRKHGVGGWVTNSRHVGTGLCSLCELGWIGLDARGSMRLDRNSRWLFLPGTVLSACPTVQGRRSTSLLCEATASYSWFCFSGTNYSGLSTRGMGRRSTWARVLVPLPHAAFPRRPRGPRDCAMWQGCAVDLEPRLISGETGEPCSGDPCPVMGPVRYLRGNSRVSSRSFSSSDESVALETARVLSSCTKDRWFCGESPCNS